MPITEETRKTLLDSHFSHEVKMMMEAVNYFRLHPTDPRRLDVDGKDLEAFLVHIRILYEFFYRSSDINSNDDTAHANHYISTWIVMNPLPDMDNWRIQINKYLAHLTYTRVTGGENGQHPYRLYPPSTLYNHFRDLIIEFLNQLPPEYQSTALEQLKTDLINTPFSVRTP